MFRKSYFSFILLACALMLGSLTAFGQFAPISGNVEMEGTHAPVAGATIEAWRLDIKQSPQTAKTGKNGSFTFAGLPLGPDFVLAVSGPGISPTAYPGVHAGTDKVMISVTAGDGHKLTEAEVRNFGTSAKNSGELTAEEKKAQAEYEQKVAENAAAKKKAEDTNKQINSLLKEGAAAFEAKNYDLAVEKFDEGYKADPEFEFSAPIMLDNKGLALRMRGWAAIQAARASGDAAAKAAAADKAKADFTAALEAHNKALEIITKAPVATGANLTNLTTEKVKALRSIVETHGYVANAGIDSPSLTDAMPALERYMAAETDSTKMLPVLLAWSNNMRNAGDMPKAIFGYRKYLEKKTDDIDAMAGLGLSLFNEGVSATPVNKEEEQEGLNFLTKFLETAPDTHPLKASVKDAIDYLKNTEKLTPQKVVSPTKRKQ